MAESKPVAAITGVGPGLGAALARRFAQGGYAVAIWAPRSPAALPKAAMRLPSMPAGQTIYAHWLKKSERPAGTC